MVTLAKNLIHITNTEGGFILPEDQRQEPEPGSVVLVAGVYGLAWQLHFTDGMWHSASPSRFRKTWEELLTERNLVLIYDAAPRDTPSTPRLLTQEEKKQFSQDWDARVEEGRKKP